MRDFKVNFDFKTCEYRREFSLSAALVAATAVERLLCNIEDLPRNSQKQVKLSIATAPNQLSILHCYCLQIVSCEQGHLWGGILTFFEIRNLLMETVEVKTHQ